VAGRREEAPPRASVPEYKLTCRVLSVVTDSCPQDRPSCPTLADSWGRTVSNRPDDDDVDEFEDYLSESLRDPGFRAAYEDAEARSRLLDHLVNIRRCFRLTQIEIAKRMQTTQSTVSEFESGATDPHLSTLQRYARAVTARLLIKVEMPTDGPWMPAGQGTYAQGSQVRIKAEHAQTLGVHFTSKWTEHCIGTHAERSINAK
jgi:transcriptional regulator with XRE-family HTH domain